MEEKAAVDLSSVSLEDLVREVKARMKSYESARAELGLNFGVDNVRAAAAPARASSTRRKGRKKGSTLSPEVKRKMSLAKKKWWADRKKGAK